MTDDELGDPLQKQFMTPHPDQLEKPCVADPKGGDLAGCALGAPANPVLRDPEDFGSREFWKAANAHAVRRWAEAADKVVQLQGLLDWAETIICNAIPEPHAEADWLPTVKGWRDAKHAAGRGLK